MKTVQMGPMSTFKQRATHLALGLGLAATLALGAVMPGMAAPGDGSVSVAVGVLAFGSTPVVNTATGITLNGTDQTTPYTIALDVNDPTGSGAGWNVTMTSTTFKGPATGTTEKNIGKSLADTASTISGRAANTCFSGTTCTTATGGTVTYPYTVPAGTTAPTATKMYSAGETTGLGRMTFSPSVSVAIPANTYAGTYTSTVTLALISTP